MKYRSISSVTSKSAITPWRSGRVAEIVAGVRPIMRFASLPTAWTRSVRVSIATTDGSWSAMPSPRTYTSVFAVPRSMAMSRPPNPRIELNIPTRASRYRSSLDGVPEALPCANSAVHHVQNVTSPEALDKARGHRAALARGAYGGHPAVGGDAIRHLAEVVVRPVHGAGEVSRLPFALLADVEDLDLPVTAGQVVHIDPRDPIPLALLGAPAPHAPGQDPAQVADPDRRGQPGG